MIADPAANASRLPFWPAVFAAWVLSLGIDLLLHAGLLARLYVEPSPFLLEPMEAFRRIPLGYLSFFVLTAALAWLVRQLDVRGARPGFRIGFLAGALVWGALAVGLFSISTASWRLLAGWWGGQALELGLAGAVIGAAAAGTSLRRLWMRVVAAVFACLVLTVIMQSLGWAPAMRVDGLP
jgi:hypothetical protein